MKDGILHPIARVEPRPAYRLLVTWMSGDQSIVDFSDDINRGGVWAVLRDETQFARARVTYRGRVLEWPKPVGIDGEPLIDVDADGLHEMAARQLEALLLGQLVSTESGEGHAA